MKANSDSEQHLAASEPISGENRLERLGPTFSDRLDKEFEDFRRRWLGAGVPVRGSERRIAALREERQELDRLVAEISSRTTKWSFSELPQLTDSAGKPVANAHKLVAGLWQAVFLVLKDNSRVVAVSFSRGAPDWNELKELLKAQGILEK